jgi:hypothetical protein
LFEQVKDTLADLLQLSHDVVSLICSVFIEVVLIYEAQMLQHLKGVYDEVKIFCDLLPCNGVSPAYPYSNFVLNIGACTSGHRDKGDKNWCMTFTLGDCEGGQLVLQELGLVFDSAPGDMVTFQSSKQTHFNLHVNGIRASLVLHSDRMGDIWADGYNRWGPTHVH